jgi:hypothetical protein
MSPDFVALVAVEQRFPEEKIRGVRDRVRAAPLHGRIVVRGEASKGLTRGRK